MVWLIKISLRLHELIAILIENLFSKGKMKQDGSKVHRCFLVIWFFAFFCLFFFRSYLYFDSYFTWYKFDTKCLVFKISLSARRLCMCWLCFIIKNGKVVQLCCYSFDFLGGEKGYCIDMLKEIVEILG